jgi:hypothetical protein
VFSFDSREKFVFTSHPQYETVLKRPSELERKTENPVYASSMVWMFGKTFNSSNSKANRYCLFVALNTGEILRYGSDSTNFEILPEISGPSFQDFGVNHSFTDVSLFVEEVSNAYVCVCCFQHDTGLTFIVKTAQKLEDWKYVAFTDAHRFFLSSPRSSYPILQSMSFCIDSKNSDKGKLCFSTMKGQNGSSDFFVEQFDLRTKAKGMIEKMKKENLVFSQTQLCFSAFFCDKAYLFPEYLPIMPETRVTVSSLYVDLFINPQAHNAGLPLAHAKVTAKISDLYKDNVESLNKLVTVQELHGFFLDYNSNRDESSLQALDFYREVLPAFVNGLQVARLISNQTGLENSTIVWKQFHDMDDVLGTVMIVTKSLSEHRYEVRNESGIVVGWFLRQHLQQVDQWSQPRNICTGTTVVCPALNVTDISSDTASCLGKVIQGSSDFTDGLFLVRKIDGSMFTASWGVISCDSKCQTPLFNCRIIKKSLALKFYDEGFRWCSGHDDSTVRCESEVQLSRLCPNSKTQIVSTKFYCSRHDPTHLETNGEVFDSKLQLFSGRFVSSDLQKKSFDVELRFTLDFFSNFPSVLSFPHSNDFLQFPWKEWSLDVSSMTFEYPFCENNSIMGVKASWSSGVSKTLQNGIFVTFFGDWPPFDHEQKPGLADLIKMGEPYEVMDANESSFRFTVQVLKPIECMKGDPIWQAVFSDKARVVARLSCVASKNDVDDVVVMKDGKTAKYLECALVPFRADVPQLCPGLILQMSVPQFEPKENVFTVVAPTGNSKHRAFHPTQNFTKLGCLFVTFDKTQDPILIATLYSGAEYTEKENYDGMGLTSKIQAVPVQHIDSIFKSFKFLPRDKEVSEKSQIDETEVLKKGDVVVRGKDWQWKDQDGRGQGKVIEEADGDKWVGVKWDSGISNK